MHDFEKHPFTLHKQADLQFNHLMLLESCVNAHIDCSVFHYLHEPVARCSASCVNLASDCAQNIQPIFGVPVRVSGVIETGIGLMCFDRQGDPAPASPAAPPYP